MKLDRFNSHGKFIDFDPELGSWVELNSSGEIGAINGVGDLLGDSCVAVVVKSGKLKLYIGKSEFDLERPDTELSYKHLGDGNTLFSAKDSSKFDQIAYKTWWASSVGIAAFGSSEDDDEDVCAYIMFMLAEGTRKRHLVSKYSDLDKPCL